LADILQTVLQLTGAGAYVGQLNQAARAHRILARAQQQQARAQAQIARAQASGRAAPAGAAGIAGGAALPGAFAGAAVAGISAVVGAIAMAVQEATDAVLAYDRAVIQTQITLKNMGRSLPSAEFTAFARSLSLATGQTETDLVNVSGYLARFRTDGQTIKRAMTDVANVAAVTTMNVEDVARTFEKMRTGNARAAFKELGIPMKGVEGQLYDLNQILTIVEQHFGSAGQLMGKELPGQVKRAEAAIQIMNNELGRLASPLTRWWADFRTGLAVAVAGTAILASRRLGIPEAGIQSQGATPGAGALGGPGRSKTEDYLRRIEMNTGPQGAMGKALRGGGAFGEPGSGLFIRDFGAMFRHTH
jgi:hypothetical protein